MGVGCLGVGVEVRVGLGVLKGVDQSVLILIESTSMRKNKSTSD